MLKQITAFAVSLTTLIVFTGCGKSSMTAENSNPVKQQAISQPQPEPNSDPNVAAITQFITDKNNAGKFIEHADDADSVLVSFDANGRRYTIWHVKGDFPPNPEVKGPWLLFFIKPTGKEDPTPTESFVCDRNGLIVVAGSGRAENIFVNKPNTKSDSAENLIRQHWQQRVDDAIATTLKYIGKPNLLTSRDL